MYLFFVGTDTLSTKHRTILDSALQQFNVCSVSFMQLVVTPSEKTMLTRFEELMFLGYVGMVLWDKAQIVAVLDIPVHYAWLIPRPHESSVVVGMKDSILVNPDVVVDVSKHTVESLCVELKSKVRLLLVSRQVEL